MKTRTKIISTAISQSEYDALRQLAFQRGKTISSFVREILLADREVKGHMELSAPTVTNKMVTTVN